MSERKSKTPKLVLKPKERGVPSIIKNVKTSISSSQLPEPTRVHQVNVKSEEEARLRTCFTLFLNKSYDKFDNILNEYFLKEKTYKQDHKIETDLVTYWRIAMPEKDKRAYILNIIVSKENYYPFRSVIQFLNSSEMTLPIQNRYLEEYINQNDHLNSFHKLWRQNPENILALELSKIEIEKTFPQNININYLIRKAITGEVEVEAKIHNIEPMYTSSSKSLKEKQEEMEEIDFTTNNDEEEEDGSNIEFETLGFIGEEDEEFMQQESKTLIKSESASQIQQVLLTEEDIDFSSTSADISKVKKGRGRKKEKNEAKEAAEKRKKIYNELREIEKRIPDVPKTINYDGTIQSILVSKHNFSNEQKKQLELSIKEKILRKYYDAYVRLNTHRLKKEFRGETFEKITFVLIIEKLDKELFHYGSKTSLIILQLNKKDIREKFQLLYKENIPLIANQVDVIIDIYDNIVQKAKPEERKTREKRPEKEIIKKLKQRQLEIGHMIKNLKKSEEKTRFNVKCPECKQDILIGVNPELVDLIQNWCYKPFKIKSTQLNKMVYKLKPTLESKINDMISKIEKEPDRQELINLISFLIPNFHRENLYFQTRTQLLNTIFKYLELEDEYKNTLSEKKLKALAVLKKYGLNVIKFIKIDESYLENISVLMKEIALNNVLYIEPIKDLVLHGNLDDILIELQKQKNKEQPIKKQGIPVFTKSDKFKNYLTSVGIDSKYFDSMTDYELEYFSEMVKTVKQDEPKINFSKIDIEDIERKFMVLKKEKFLGKRRHVEEDATIPYFPDKNITDNFVSFCKEQLQFALKERNIDLYIYDKTSLYMEDAFEPFHNSTQKELLKAIATLICVSSIPEIEYMLKNGLISSLLLLTTNYLNNYFKGFSIQKPDELDACIEENMIGLLSRYSNEDYKDYKNLKPTSINYFCGDKNIPRENIILYREDDDVYCFDIDELKTRFRNRNFLNEKTGRDFNKKFTDKFFIEIDGKSHFIYDIKKVENRAVNPETKKFDVDLDDRLDETKEYFKLVNNHINSCKNYIDALDIPYDKMIFYRDEGTHDLYCFSRTKLLEMALQNKYEYYGIQLDKDFIDRFKPKIEIKTQETNLFDAVNEYFKKKESEPKIASVLVLNEDKSKEDNSKKVENKSPVSEKIDFETGDNEEQDFVTLNEGFEIDKDEQEDIDETIEELEGGSPRPFGFKAVSSNCEKCGKENPKNNSYKTIIGPDLKHVEFCSSECMEAFHFPKY